MDQDPGTVDRTDEHDSPTNKIKDVLASDGGDESHELRRDHVDRYEDERVYLGQRR